MVASPNVSCFLRLSRFQGHLDLPIFKLQCERIAKKTSEKFHKIPNFRAFSLRDFFLKGPNSVLPAGRRVLGPFTVFQCLRRPN